MKLLPLALLLTVSASTVGCAASVRRIGYSAEPAPAATAAPGKGACPVLITADAAAVAQARLLGEIRYGDTGFSTRCDEARALRLFQSEACAVSANVVLITDERSPGFASSCYRASASLYASADTLAVMNVRDRRTPERLGVNRGAGSGRQLLGIVGYAVGFVAGYVLVDLISGGN